MDPSIMSAIFKVLKEIAKAEREARRNQERCRELAQRANVVSNVLGDARNNAAAEATKQMILCRLQEALDDALKLVESCRDERDSSSGGCLLSLSWATSRLNSGARAARFDEVDKRITNCLVELNATSGTSMEKKIDRLSVTFARDRHHAGTKKQRKNKARNMPQKGASGQGGQNGEKGGKKRRGKKKNTACTGSRPTPPPPVAYASVHFHQNGHGCTAYRPHYHSVEEDPNSCSVM